MSYHVLARKWRPQTFADLVGQNHVVKALTYALSHQQIHHAYLFTGTRGVGKTSIARIFAKSLNCETNGISPSPCGECETCIEIKSGKFVDLIEVDAASRSQVDETRNLIDSVSYLPSKGRYKVYLIDEVHMFSKGSFNALLKTLEEPPEHVKFILATTDPEKLPITILSRCLQFNLKSLTSAQIRQHLANICEAESIQYDSEALELLARAGDGSMRDTLSMTDQAISYGQGMLNLSAVSEILGTIQPNDIEAILFAIATNNPNQLNQALHRLDEYEVDAHAFLIEIMRRLQRMAWAKEGIVEDLSPALQSTVNDIPKPLLHLWYDIAEKALPKLLYAGEPRQAVEMVLLRMLAFIPEDWVVRHRTLLETPTIAAPEITETPTIPKISAASATATHQVVAEIAPVDDFAHHVHATPVVEHDSLESAEAQFSGEPLPPPQTEQSAPNEQRHIASESVETDSVSAPEPVNISIAPEMEVATSQTAEQINTNTDHIVNAEAVTNAPITHDSAQNSMQAPISASTQIAEPIAPKSEVAISEPIQSEQMNAQSLDESWHLSRESEEQTEPPSMEDIHAMMQSGRDIQSPTTQPINQAQEQQRIQQSELDPPPLSADDIPPWEEVAEMDTSEITPPIENKKVATSEPIADATNTINTEPKQEQQHTEITNTDVEKTTKKVATLSDNYNGDFATFEWHKLLPALGLSDYSHHLASLGILRVTKADSYLQATLDLPPQNSVLVTEDSLQEINQALENHFNTPINLEMNFTLIDEPTPSERNKQIRENKQNNLQETFLHEPITEKLLSELDGKVIESTVKTK